MSVYTLLTPLLTYNCDSLAELLLNRDGGGEHEIDDEGFDLVPVVEVDFVRPLLTHLPVTLHIVLKCDGARNLETKHFKLFVTTRGSKVTLGPFDSIFI